MNCLWMEVVPAVCLEVTEIGVTAWSTVIIAIFTVLLFIWQSRLFRHEKKVANANYKISLHEKRLKVYFVLKEFFEDAVTHGKPSREATVKVLGEAREVPFIFGEDVNREVEWLIEASFDYMRLEIKLERLDDLYRRHVIKPAQEQQREELLEKMDKLEDDLFERSRRGVLSDIFVPYLKLPESL